MEYFKRAAEVKTPLPSPILAVYFEQYLHAGGIVTANKEVLHVIDLQINLIWCTM